MINQHANRCLSPVCASIEFVACSSSKKFEEKHTGWKISDFAQFKEGAFRDLRKVEMIKEAKWI